MSEIKKKRPNDVRMQITIVMQIVVFFFIEICLSVACNFITFVEICLIHVQANSSGIPFMKHLVFNITDIDHLETSFLNLKCLYKKTVFCKKNNLKIRKKILKVQSLSLCIFFCD